MCVDAIIGNVLFSEQNVFSVSCRDSRVTKTES